MTLVVETKVKNITMQYNGQYGHKGYVTYPSGAYSLGIKSIVSSDELNIQTQSYGGNATSQILGYQPKQVKLSCVILGVSNTSDLISLADDLQKHRSTFGFTEVQPSVNNIFLPGMYLYVTDNSSLIYEMPINTIWVIQTVSTNRTNQTKGLWIFDLTLLRDVKYENLTWSNYD